MRTRRLLLVGQQGSGKSTYAQKLLKKGFKGDLYSTNDLNTAIAIDERTGKEVNLKGDFEIIRFR